MPALYDRFERDDEVIIRLTGTWYLLRYALIAALIGFVVSEGLTQASPASYACGGVLIAVMAFRIVGFRSARTEITRAMRDGSLKVGGSTWNHNNPLRYAFRPSPPESRVVRES